MASNKTPVPPANLKGTSPSPNINRGNDGWNAQQGYATPQQALADKHNERPIPVGGGKK